MSYEEFFLGTPSAIVQLDCISVTHPDFAEEHHYVRNAVSGVTVTLELGGGSRTYLYYPMGVKPLGFKDDLDQGFAITLGDTGDTLPDEIDRVQAADGFTVMPAFQYRAYRSDDLTAPLFGPVNLVIKRITMGKEGATFEARAPLVTDGRTGELYRLDRFPMLRGLL